MKYNKDVVVTCYTPKVYGLERIFEYAYGGMTLDHAVYKVEFMNSKNKTT
jgi:hypothetical protein